MLIKLAYYF